MTPPKEPQLNTELILYRLDEIKHQLVEIKKDYVTKAEFDSFKDEVTVELHRKAFNNWLNPILASISTGAIVLLIQYALTH